MSVARARPIADDIARDTGIEALGGVPWGTQICLFYETRDDAFDTLVPYLEAGLRNEERCFWVVSDPITEDDAKAALCRAMPDAEQLLARGAIEIVPGRDWQLASDRFELEMMTADWDRQVAAALADGYRGLRISCNASWMQTHYGKEFNEYEQDLDRALAGRFVILLCTYPLRKSRAVDVMDVARAHQFTLARRRGAWERVETPELEQARQEIWKLKADLEERVEERTRELAAANERLQAENTERERIEAVLKEAQDALARAARLTSISALAASIAHEINQPLTGIVTSSEAALRWLTNEEPNLAQAKAGLERIVRDANRAAEVIKRIRALVAGKAEHVRVDINDAIREVSSLMRGTLTQHGVDVRLELSPDIPPAVGDRLQLQQAIMNLQVNAVEAMAGSKGPREIVIRTGLAEAGELLVSVEDRGCGLDPGVVGQLFDPFFTTKPEGMGLGLSIVRSVVEAHGGGLWARPASPRGAIFHFTVTSAPG